MIAWPSGATASTQPSSTLTCNPGAVARGSAVIRLMSPCAARPLVLMRPSKRLAGRGRTVLRLRPSRLRASGRSWGVADGAGEGGAVLDHVVEERLVAADALGDDAQEAPLQVGDRVVELVEHLRDPGHRVLGDHLVRVGGRELTLQRVAGGDRRRPVEHLLPVGVLARRRRLDEQPGVAGLAVGAGRDPALLGLERRREELLEHPVGGVEEVDRQVVAGEHEARLEAAADAVDDRPTLRRRPALEREQVDLEDLTHSRRSSRAR